MNHVSVEDEVYDGFIPKKTVNNLEVFKFTHFMPVSLTPGECYGGEWAFLQSAQKTNMVKNQSVSLTMGYPAFPTPDGKSCVDSEHELLRFVFGKEIKQHPLLQGVKVEVRLNSNPENTYEWRGVSITFIADNPEKHSQVDGAARLLYYYLKDRLPIIRETVAEKEKAYIKSCEQTEQNMPLFLGRLAKWWRETGHANYLARDQEFTQMHLKARRVWESRYERSKMDSRESLIA